MANWLSAEVERSISFAVYRFRFLGVYTVIGVLSLLVEALIRRQLLNVFPAMVATVVAVCLGMLFAYAMNVRFNFKIPRAKRRSALLYFMTISSGSAVVQLLLWQLGRVHLDWSYEQVRFVISGCLFLFAYILHRRFSFQDFKRVGVAVYANGIEDIPEIHTKIGQYADFIHVDVVDETFGPEAPPAEAYKLEVIRAFWPGKEIHTHIMSRRPRQWLDHVVPYSDLVIVHSEIEDDLSEVISRVRDAGRLIGVCLLLETPVAAIAPHLPVVDLVMFLAIPTPGVSGQALDMRVVDKVQEMGRTGRREGLRLCVDGGVNEHVVGYLEVEDVVSGSYVLNSPDPKRQIMRLQTCGNHEP